MREYTAARSPRTSAIEVVAQMGDTVIDVKQCVAQRRSRTWLVATSALCLLTSALAFNASLDRAAENAAALLQHLATKHPAYSFRPIAQSPAISVVVLAGLGIALVTAVAALLRGRRERSDYRVGTAPGVDLALASTADAAFPLFVRIGDAYVVTVTNDLLGELSVDGAAVSLAELAQGHSARPSSRVANAIEIPIPRRAKIRVGFGAVIVHASSIDEPLPISLRPRAVISRTAIASAAVALALYGGITSLEFELELDADAEDGGIAIWPGEPIDGELVDAIGDDDGGTSTHDDDSGTSTHDDGSEDVAYLAPTLQLQFREPGPPQLVPVGLARELAIASALHAGWLDSAALRTGITSLVASTDLRGGFDGTGVYRESSSTAAMFADRRRFAPDGGGTGWGALCDDGCRYSTLGHGNGTGEGYDPRSRSIRGGREHLTRVPDSIALGRPTQSGGIPVEILRRYFKRKSDELSGCFEKALLATPTLSGTVVTDFIVAPDGSVHGASASGAGDLATCVSSVVSSMKFPAPDGGQAVRVSYPLQFRVPGAG
ncbi:MAG TPA: AgmX/PglI C-terminal domain-containing protein [Kofleriaceae bacterium]|jgi:hypothetical protein